MVSYEKVCSLLQECKTHYAGLANEAANRPNRKNRLDGIVLMTDILMKSITDCNGDAQMNPMGSIKEAQNIIGGDDTLSFITLLNYLDAISDYTEINYTGMFGIIYSKLYISEIADALIPLRKRNMSHAYRRFTKMYQKDEHGKIKSMKT